jgi:tryptophan synthase alpha chain
MAGYPDVPTSRALAEAALDVGIDGFEIAVPFSDPLADGTTLQRANARALAGGANLDTALGLMRFIRERAPDTPLIIMSYYNPLRQRGEERVAAALAEVGADGAIVADMPPEEAGPFQEALATHHLALIPLVAPTSPDERVRAVAALHPAFVYCVALVGVTGARQDLAATLAGFLQRVKTATSAPLVVGFGISRPEHVHRVAELGADGAIVASALADLIEQSADPVAAARHYLAELKGASRSGVDPAPAPATP